jgi:hypothetical protein
VLVQVKANQPTLLAACEDLAGYRAAVQCDVQHDKGHGRIETRTVRTYEVPANWLEDDWQALVKQVVSVSRTVERRKRTGGWERTSETAWWVSTAVMSAATCQMAIRGHWSVENQNHYVRDVVLREDHCTRAIRQPCFEPSVLKHRQHVPTTFPNNGGTLVLMFQFHATHQRVGCSFFRHTLPLVHTDVQ